MAEGATHDHPLAEAVAEVAVEALGGTPPDVRRPPASPVRFVVPPAVSGPIGRLDHAADRAFDRLRGHPLADRLLYGASALGDFSLIWHLAGTAGALRSREGERRAARLALALLGESVLVNAGVKSLFRRARPPWEQDRPLPLRRPRSSSFPSGHATSGFMAATLLSDRRPRAAPAWFALAATVAASRVHVRIHHASDVLGGAVVGIALGIAVRRTWPAATNPDGRP